MLIPLSNESFEHMQVWEYSKEAGLSLDPSIKLLIFDCDGTLIDTVQNKIIEEIVAIAKQFHGILPLAVASGGGAESVNSMLEQHNLNHLFEVVVTADDVNWDKVKPHPDLFLIALNQVGMAIHPEECLVFEDSHNGFKAADAARMHLANVHEILYKHYS